MKIKFLKPEKSRFGDWQPGEVEDVDDTEAERLIAAGIADTIAAANAIDAD